MVRSQILGPDCLQISPVRSGLSPTVRSGQSICDRGVVLEISRSGRLCKQLQYLQDYVLQLESYNRAQRIIIFNLKLFTIVIIELFKFNNWWRFFSRVCIWPKCACDRRDFYQINMASTYGTIQNTNNGVGNWSAYIRKLQ